MCIRDRFKSFPLPRPSPTGQPQDAFVKFLVGQTQVVSNHLRRIKNNPVRFRQGLANIRAHDKDCLLYTSDAADDM
eukprot:11618311-Alexandrium_andersonii.AAC.1